MEEINKNIYFNQEISTEEKSLKYKIFDYFYYILNEKNETSLFTLYFFHIFEIIQLISYAFTSQHLYTWKMPVKIFNIVSKVTAVFRLCPLLQYVPFKVFTIVFFVFAALNFIFCLILIVQVLFGKLNSKSSNRILSIIHITIAPLTIFFFNPISELLLIPLKCTSTVIFTNTSSIKCWKDIHYLFVVLGIINEICFFICLFFLNIFYFNPFQTKSSTIKLNTTIDIILLGTKLIYVLQLMLIKNEYISISILLILSFFLLYQEFVEPIYNNNVLELLLNIRNISLFWTFLMSLVSKASVSTDNGLIYLLIFGYPIIIFSFSMFFNNSKNKFNYTNSSFNNVNSCIEKTRFLIRLINSFIDDNKNNLKFNEKGDQKNDILLKGFVKMHTETCLKEECPLTKFLKNEGNFNIQKQCLLNYMTIYFNNAMKKFPYCLILRLYHIKFNFIRKYNLNSVRANLEDIKKMKYGINEEFIIYCIEKEIEKMKINGANDGSEVEKEAIIIEQNYKRLKDLISKATK